MNRHGRGVFASLAGAAWIVATTSAQSCGFEDPSSVTSARAMIDWAYPKSLHVMSAVWRAQLDGLIAGSARGPSATSILGNYGRSSHLLRRLGEEMAPYQTDPARPSVSLVLMSPVLWTRYTAGAGRLKAQIHTRGPAAGDVVVVTDEPVIEALLSGRLTADAAENRGLIRYYGAQADVSAIRSVLRQIRRAAASR